MIKKIRYLDFKIGMIENEFFNVRSYFTNPLNRNPTK